MAPAKPRARPVLPPADDPAPIRYGQLDDRLGYVLRRAQIAVFQDFYRAVAAFDISPAQYSALTLIEHNPGLTQTRIAEAIGIKKANFVALIKALEGRGLVNRHPVPGDRRAVALRLSEAGVRLMPDLHAASQDHEEAILTAVGSRGREDLARGLGKIARLGARETSD